MTETWDELGGQPHPAEDPKPAVRRKPKPRPFCSTACRLRGGWVETDDGVPARRCECRGGDE